MYTADTWRTLVGLEIFSVNLGLEIFSVNLGLEIHIVSVKEPWVRDIVSARNLGLEILLVSRNLGFNPSL